MRVPHCNRMKPADIPTGLDDGQAEAAARINWNVAAVEQEGQTSPDALKKKIDDDIGHVSAPARHHLVRYLNGMGESTQDMEMDDLGDGIGGEYDGSKKTMATDTMVVDESVETTVARMEETGDHEKFHADNKHLEPMETAATAESPETLVMGGQKFQTDTPVKEGWTVENTGNVFVHDIYRQYQQDLMNAASAAGIGMEQLHEAIDEKKDLTLIDDRTRETSDGEMPAAMSV